MSSTTAHPNRQAKATFRVFVRQLHRFFFRNQTVELIVYGVALLIALLYAFINDFVLGRARDVVMLEGSIAAALALVSIVLVYNLWAVRSEKSDLVSRGLSQPESPPEIDAKGHFQLPPGELANLARIWADSLTSATSNLASFVAEVGQSQDKLTTNLSQQIANALSNLACVYETSHENAESRLATLVAEIVHSQDKLATELSHQMVKLTEIQIEAMAKVGETISQRIQDSLSMTRSEVSVLVAYLARNEALDPLAAEALRHQRDHWGNALSVTHGVLNVTNLLLQPSPQVVPLPEGLTSHDDNAKRHLVLGKDIRDLPIIWYDSNGRIIKVLFIGEHGISIVDPKIGSELHAPK